MTVPNFMPYDRPLQKELINTFVVGVSNVYLSGEIYNFKKINSHRKKILHRKTFLLQDS